MERFIEPAFFILILQSLTFSSLQFFFSFFNLSIRPRFSIFQSVSVFQSFNLSIFQSFNLSILLVFQFLFKVEREGDNLAACLLGSIGIHIALRGVWQEAVFMTLVETIC